MAKTKTTQVRAGPSAQTLSDLAKRFADDMNKTAEAREAAEARESKESEPVPEPANPNPKESKPKVSAPATRVTGKRTVKEKIDADLLLECDGFNPAALSFSLSWSNYDKVKEHFECTDEETTTLLLAMCGLKLGKKYWNRYDVPMDLFDQETGNFQPEKVKPKKATKAKEVRSAVEETGQKFETWNKMSWTSLKVLV